MEGGAFLEKSTLYLFWLVVLTILKNISQLGRIIPYMMENKTCLKPPTSIIVCLIVFVYILKRTQVPVTSQQVWNPIIQPILKMFSWSLLTVFFFRG